MTKPHKENLRTLSKYKWKRLGAESLENSLRLHRDAILLFNAGSFPSAYQLSILSLEEFAKAKMVEHYFYSSITNEGFASSVDEQEWLKLLYVHSEKQFAFVAREINYSASFVDAIKKGHLEKRKQKSVYVGLERNRKNINVDKRISTPKSIKQAEVKKMISWINAEFLYAYNSLIFYECYYGIDAMDEVLLSEKTHIIFEWPHKSRTRVFQSYPKGSK